MYDRQYTLFCLGNSSVGKTSYILRYSDNDFSFHMSSTIGVDYKDKIETLDNKERVKITLYDTSGQERYKSISFNMLKYADAVLLFYDITNRQSFNSVKDWIESIYNFKDKKFPIVLIGNKIDNEEERVITKDEGESEALKYNIKFFEISCKDSINIREPILHLISIIKSEKENGGNIRLNPKLKKKKEKKKCC